MSGAWQDIGLALEDANLQWDVHLMPQPIADMRDEISRRYARDPRQKFEGLIEAVVEEFDLDQYSDEWHAAKQVLGTLFVKRRIKRHQYNYTKIGD